MNTLKNITKVNIDISTLCNHVCDFCSNPDERTEKFRISLSDFIAVMDNIGKYIDFSKIEQFGLSAKGEPLLNKDFIDIVKVAKKKFNVKYIYISSNGVNLNKKTSKEVFEAGLDSIKFSINAINQKQYKKTHGKDHFFRAISGVKNAIEIKKNKKIKIFISCISADSQQNIENFWKKELNGDYKYIDGIWKRELLFSPIETIYKEPQGDVLVSCNKPFDEIWVNADAHLLLCCMDYFKEEDLGSLLENDFLTLWNGDRMSEIREMHRTREFPENHICHRCLLYNFKAGATPG